MTEILPRQLVAGKLPTVAAWVIDCGESNQVSDAMQWIEPQVLALSNRPKPGPSADYLHWCRRIANTLERWTADFWHASNDSVTTDPGRFPEVEAVWVIAGSTGGVPAAARFFASFTHVPPVAFIYAQHIHADQERYLTAVAHANQDLRCSMARGRNWFNPGHILIAPAACKLRFSSHGEVFSVRDEWGTAETPNIDELLLTMSGLRPAPAGALLLSGTGKDGCRGLHSLHAVGSRVWVQSPASAVAPSMPESAIAANIVQHQGTPEELAADFMSLYPEPCKPLR
ncbi:chemotaxis protein CheB [Candidatus Litorirhabdus singularis]|uniref:chemotaxis protein CheB n=1 Tax=Candidatus Litorirhabdus singularis TaxID=2518993 RepID=UPI002432798B|nr:chemotaxis protein CheB [Candidatus Litorirhabdus singularis]